MIIDWFTNKTPVLRMLVAVAALIAANAQAATWKVDSAQSRLAFSATQTGSPFYGQFRRYDAKIVLDPDHLSAAYIKVTVDTASAVTGESQRDSALQDKDWFDAATFPHAQFEARSIYRTGAGGYVAQGTLTIRSVTRSVTVPMTIHIAGDTARLKGNVQINRADFGIGRGVWGNPQWVGLQVEVSFDLIARRAASS